jgi:Protein of unknown function (DUF1549)/Protein of unknown function (DUF1553)
MRGTFMPSRSFAPALLAFALLPSLRAAELLPATKPVEETIDHYIDAKLSTEGITPAAQADDATLIRRLTLDLTGRIPTPVETREFVESNDPAKRAKLVDRLMASPGFVRQQATEFDVMLMQGTNGSIRPYLQTAFAENRKWDAIFRDLLLPSEKEPMAARGNKPATTGKPVDFLRMRLADMDKLTTEVSVVFFGVNVSCARCHDHPLVPDWKQDHFFGMKSFFARTYDMAGFVAEREVGLVKFQTTKGQSKQAQMMFLTGKVVEAPGMKEPSKDEEKKEKEAIEKAKKEKSAPPTPKFSARQQLVETALRADSRDFFARSIVNRLWARLYGIGLVTPVDQMHSENPASHPELLQWLARDTAEHGYDLRRLIRGLVMSNAYSRSSRWDASGEPPLPKTFAVARVRPLTSYQFAFALRMATLAPAQFEKLKPEELEKKIDGIEGGARGMQSLFEWPGDEFQVGVSEALLFSNSDRIQKDLLADSQDRLLAKLKLLKEPKEQVQMAVRSVFCREASADEVKTLEAFLAKRADRPAEALRQMVWALLCSSEFRFNY